MTGNSRPPSAQAKRKARRAAEALEKEKLNHVAALAAVDDLLKDYRPFQHFERDGIRARLDFYHGKSLKSEAIDACVALTLESARLTGQEVSPDFTEARRRSLCDCSSRIIMLRACGVEEDNDEWLVVSNSSSSRCEFDCSQEEGGGWCGERAEIVTSPGAGDKVEMYDLPADALGFVQLSLIGEPGLVAICVVDHQLVPWARNKGLGKHVMRLVQLIARKNGMGVLIAQETPTSTTTNKEFDIDSFDLMQMPVKSPAASALARVEVPVQ